MPLLLAVLVAPVDGYCSCEQLSVGLAHASQDGSSGSAGAAEGHEGGINGGGGGFAINAFGMVLDIGGVYEALLQAACVLVVVGGLEASKYTVNTFCVAKVCGMAWHGIPHRL